MREVMRVPDDKAAPAAPAVELDEAGRKLQQDAEKAKYVEAIAKARLGTAEARAASLKAVVPSVADAPKGEVTLGEKAGAFGPWQAHAVVDTAAEAIARQVTGHLAGQEARVLVVADQSLLPGDWTARLARSTLDRQCTRLKTLGEDLTEGLRRLTSRAGSAGDRVGGPGRRRGATDADGTDTTPAEEEADATAAPSGAGGALGAAVDLLGLLRTDFTITATAVAAASAELASLTAGHLAAGGTAASSGAAGSGPGGSSAPATPPAPARAPAAPAPAPAPAAGVGPAGGAGGRPTGLSVEADGFSTVRPSSAVHTLGLVLGFRDAAVDGVRAIEAELAPLEAELTSLGTRLATLEKTWATAVAEKKDAADTEKLHTAVRTLAKEASRLQEAVGPARTLVSHAEQVVADVDAAVAALVQAPEGGGEAPLLTAVRRERLQATFSSERITHVLAVSLDAVAADAVTRRSILGTSGRIRFLGAANASWLLLDAAGGTVVRGGQESPATVLTYDLESGAAQARPATEWLGGSGLGDDPLTRLEVWAKALVLVLALALFAVGAFAVVAAVDVISN